MDDYCRKNQYDETDVAQSVVDEMGYGVKGELVAVEAHAGDGAGGDRADDRALAELVAGGRIGDVDLHQRQIFVDDHVGSVGESVAVVGKGRRVHDHRGLFVGGLMHPMHHFGFVVSLTHFDFETKLLAPLGAEFTQSVEILTAVDVWLTDAQTTEVRAVDDDYFGHVLLLRQVPLSQLR